MGHVITHMFGHRSHSQAPKAVSADHRAACMIKATATLNGRSDASCGCDSLVWIHCDAAHTDRVKSRAFIMRICVAAHVILVKTGEKELHGSDGKHSGAVRGPLCLSG